MILFLSCMAAAKQEISAGQQRGGMSGWVREGQEKSVEIKMCVKEVIQEVKIRKAIPRIVGWLFTALPDLRPDNNS